jgi:Glutathione S-transferase, N-terminal domain
MPEDDAAGMSAAPPDPVLYGRYASPFVRRVAMTLRLYGIACRHVPLMPFGPDKVELVRFRSDRSDACVPSLRCNHKLPASHRSVRHSAGCGDHQHPLWLVL